MSRVPVSVLGALWVLCGHCTVLLGKLFFPFGDAEKAHFAMVCRDSKQQSSIEIMAESPTVNLLTIISVGHTQ